MGTVAVVVLTLTVLLAVKLLLIPAYSSTDLEVHRNWMAITFNKKIAEWYFEETSEWTLDYPPFFAYFEFVLASIAEFTGFSDILSIQKDPLMNKRVLYFMRLTVIATDHFYVLACGCLCFLGSHIWFSQPTKIVPKAKLALFVLLVSHAGLILVDNIHFQYNGLLSAILVLSIYLAEKGNYLMAAFSYCVLLNFKHIYLYYAPAFVFFYLRHYFDVWIDFGIGKSIIKGVALLGSLFVPICMSFATFVAAGGFEQIKQILTRLFPVSRGLTHAYWAPNFWALYNFADLVMYRIFTILNMPTNGPPTYSSGLVQEHFHSVLPVIDTFTSLAAVVLSLFPLGLLFFKRRRTDFALYLTLSGLSFFFFGYHVHEKALLLVSIPLQILSFSNPSFVPVSVLFSTITTFSIFPLLYTNFELPIKYGIGATYFILSLVLTRYAFNVRMSFILPLRSKIFISGLVIVELYATFVHNMIFQDRLPFLPLMLTSVYNAIAVTYCYFWIIKLAIEDEYLLLYKKKKCELMEELIKTSSYPVQSVESIEEVQIVGGVDISTSKTNAQFAVVSLTLFSFPNLEHLASHEEVVIITEPYITDYLALREADSIASVVRGFLDKNPSLRPDVLICDGNGRFHSRGCGVACHIGARSGIASIGVAKNLNLSLLKKCNASDEVVEKAEKLIESISSEKHDGFLPFDVIEPVVMNVLRLGGSKVPVFVSAGYGIELDLSTEIVAKCARNRICEPIRTADLRSREKVRQLFD